MPCPRLYNLPGYAREIGSVLAEYALQFFEKYPELIVDLRKELLDFVNNRKNVSDERENFFIHIVWLLGEMQMPICIPCRPSVMSVNVSAVFVVFFLLPVLSSPQRNNVVRLGRSQTASTSRRSASVR